MTSTLSTQRFCLRWNNHQSNLLSVFDQLLHDESFVDVTLAVEGRLLRAHKMVLSACSPYFQALFMGHPDKHPIVILKDVPFCDMRSLLEFMYRGEVSVDQDRLTAFLKVAESLRIKGLTEVNEEKCDLPSITSSLLSNVPNVPLVTTHTPSPPNLHRFTPGPASHKRAGPPLPPHSRSNPLLGSALTAPKRKRGRPRKLSGSSGNDSLPNLLPVTTVSQNPATTNGSNGENTSGSRSQTQTPSNTLDDNHSELETGNRSEGMNAAEGERSGGVNSAEGQRSGGVNSAEGQRSGGVNASEGQRSEGMEVAEGQGQDQCEGPDYKRSLVSGDRQPEGENGAGSTSIPSPNQLSTPIKDLIAKQIKEEPEPTPGPSSQDPGQAFLRPSGAQEPENYALGLIPAPSKYLLMSGGNMVSQPSRSANGTLEKSPDPLLIPKMERMDSCGTGTGECTTPRHESDGSVGGGGLEDGSDPMIQGSLSAPPATRPPTKRRPRRRATSASQDPAEQLTEMSVRGLNLFRYASISEGVYKCTECAKSDVQKTFKNKYSFQRHAFLYHEGHQRKVFPCPVCAKEFSRPDKMKNHMKTVHDCFMPKDCVFPLGFFLPP